MPPNGHGAVCGTSAILVCKGTKKDAKSQEKTRFFRLLLTYLMAKALSSLLTPTCPNANGQGAAPRRCYRYGEMAGFLPQQRRTHSLYQHRDTKTQRIKKNSVPLCLCVELQLEKLRGEWNIGCLVLPPQKTIKKILTKLRKKRN